jgi:hypothetical protein
LRKNSLLAGNCPPAAPSRVTIGLTVPQSMQQRADEVIE